MTYTDSAIKSFYQNLLVRAVLWYGIFQVRRNQRTPSYNLLIRDCTEQVNMNPTIETKMQVNDLIKGWGSVIT